MSTEGRINPELLEETRRQLREMVRQLDELAKTSSSPDEFFPAFLQKIVEALSAVGGAVWLAREQGTMLEYQVNLAQTELLTREENLNKHGNILGRVIETGEPLMVHPAAEAGPLSASNPTKCVLLLVPLIVQQQTAGVLEVFQRPETSLVARTGHMRFVSKLGDLAADFLRDREMRQLSFRQELFTGLDHFTKAVHSSLDPKAVAYQIANEGQRLMHADRVSVAIRRGSGWRLQSISGVDTIERRSNLVRTMEKLMKTVLPTGEPLWYSGDDTDLPENIRNDLHDYLDESQARSLGIFPLTEHERPDVAPEAPEEDRPTRPPKAIGAMVVEFFEQGKLQPGTRSRVEFVADHGGEALANAVSVDSMFLMPVWRELGRATWIVRGRTLPKTLAVLALILVAIVTLIVIPADFDMQARGTLEPELRRDVFANVDGVVDKVLVGHGDPVQTGDVLIMLRNDELDIELATVEGKIQETRQKIAGITGRLAQKLPPQEHNRLASELKPLQETLIGLLKEQELLSRQAKDLLVRAPKALTTDPDEARPNPVLEADEEGDEAAAAKKDEVVTWEVITWDVKELLEARPVQRGQVLLTVADPSRDWILEIHMPEHRMGHVAEAKRKADEAGEPLEVEFVLATDPRVTRTGTVKNIARQAEVDEKQENTVLIKVAFDKSQLPATLFRPGAAVRAKIHCGRTSLGYVWLHDPIDWVYREVLFRLF